MATWQIRLIVQCLRSVSLIWRESEGDFFREWQNENEVTLRSVVNKAFEIEWHNTLHSNMHKIGTHTHVNFKTYLKRAVTLQHLIVVYHTQLTKISEPYFIADMWLILWYYNVLWFMKDRCYSHDGRVWWRIFPIPTTVVQETFIGYFHEGCFINNN